MLSEIQEIKPVMFMPRVKESGTVPAHLIPQELMIYLKTTETCQLNCKHCFTNGINGRKIYFDPDAVIDWFTRLHKFQPNLRAGSVAFHGGEPFLAPIEDIRKVWATCKDLWPNVWWSTTTNLVYKLTPEIREFMKEAFTRGIATSWDKGIRFDNQKQEDLWKENVKTLRADGHTITLMVSLNKQITDMDPHEFIKMIADLDIEYLHLERITANGNAVLNSDIMPSNVELDRWLLKLWHATIETKAYEKFTNLFFDGVLSSYMNKTHSGCRCRSCEQKIFTLNADGTIGGCPNSAVNTTFGALSDSIESLLTSHGRVENIVCEAQRDPRCYSCEVFDTCNGDCHQLAWQGDVCAAPKSLMKELEEKNETEVYKKVLDNFIGVE